MRPNLNGANKPGKNKGRNRQVSKYLLTHSNYIGHSIQIFMSNPFCATSKLNLPLPLERCQAIHFTALKRLVKGECEADARPETFDMAVISDQVRLYGWEICLFHPEYVLERFSLVTTTVYQAIKNLYCERIGRSIVMVDRILQAMAVEAQLAPLPYETVWSICVYLHRMRDEALQLNIQQIETSWLISTLELDITIIDQVGKQFSPAIAFVIDVAQDKIVAFQVGDLSDIAKLSQQALYAAFAAWRSPEALSPGGLKWHLPKQLFVPSAWADHCALTLRSLGIAVTPCRKHSEGCSSMLSRLKGNWSKDLHGRIIPKQNFEAIFDNLLFRWQGDAPWRTELERTQQYQRLIGFNYEPAAVVPALRELLPTENAVISDGAVLYDELHYQHELLAYWPGAPVLLRRLPEKESSCWIYLDNMVLCEAKAQELRRKDGSYRTSRSGR